MKKILITGFSGFVSHYFLQHLIDTGGKSDILGVDIQQPAFLPNGSRNLKIDFQKTDLLEAIQLENIIYNFRPDYVLHLASYSSVGFSWKNPSLSVRNNMNIFLNLMEILREVCPSCRVLSVGSSEEYGNYPERELPLKEHYPLYPVSPYAVARVSQEQLSKVYCEGYGMDVVMTRSFNHIGPGQKDVFVISSFVKQLVEIKKGLQKGNKLLTGDTSIIRDFLDVRDVVDAYWRLFQHGQAGEVYNVCSGHATSLKDVIDMICEILDLDVQLEIDQKRIRPNDNRMIVGSNDKLRQVTGWQQQISLKESLTSIIDYWVQNT